MTYVEFLQSVKGNRFAPIYLFHGEEDFLIDEGIQLIVDKTLDEGSKGFNLDVVYGSKAEAKDVVGHASSFPMIPKSTPAFLNRLAAVLALFHGSLS